ncbi:MAG: NAD(P)-binding domain-containing protein [Polyangiaceae bacterium]
MSKVAVLGSGQVGQVLADGFLKHGHEVMRGSREPAKLEDWKKAATGSASTGTFEEAAKFGEIVVLAVKGTAAESAVDLAGSGLEGKVVLDATNPIADAPPQNGALVYFTAANESLMERLQKKAPTAKFVKAFSCVGNAFMVNPDFGGTRPTMFICGNDADAKATAAKILDQFGWDSEDMGGVEAARPIEALCILWCLPGFTRNQWSHAFKLLKK